MVLLHLDKATDRWGTMLVVGSSISSTDCSIAHMLITATDQSSNVEG